MAVMRIHAQQLGLKGSSTVVIILTNIRAWSIVNSRTRNIRRLQPKEGSFTRWNLLAKKPQKRLNPNDVCDLDEVVLLLADKNQLLAQGWMNTRLLSCTR